VPKRVSPELDREIRRLAAKGHGLRVIGRLVHRSKHAVTNVLTRDPNSTPVVWNPSPARLSRAEREEIRVGLERGDTFTAIAAVIGRAVSTVSREVAANGGRDNYQGWLAHHQAGCRAQRPKTPKPRLSAAGQSGHRPAGGVVVARGDQPVVADRVPRRSDDVGEERDRLGDLLAGSAGTVSTTRAASKASEAPPNTSDD
jgi:hypothetical protein